MKPSPRNTWKINTGMQHEQRGLNMDTFDGKLIYWRRIPPKLKKLENEDKLKEIKEKPAK